MTRTPAQWELASQHEAVSDFLDTPKKAIDKLDTVPALIDEEASVAYGQLVLEELAKIRQWAYWLQRVILERQVANKGVTRKKISQITGLSTATVHQWANKPLLSNDNDEYGPGLVPGPLDTVIRKPPPMDEDEVLPLFRQCECDHSQWMHSDGIGSCTFDGGGPRCPCPMFTVVAG